jgi:hypothetical protein
MVAETSSSGEDPGHPPARGGGLHRKEQAVSRAQSAGESLTVPEVAEGVPVRDDFVDLLEGLTRDLRALEGRQIRLSDIDFRLRRLGEMEDAALLSAKQYRRMPAPHREAYDSFVAVLLRHRTALRNAYRDPVVVRDIVDSLRDRWSSDNPGRRVPCGTVLAVLRGLPYDGQTAATIGPITLRGTASSRTSILLRCEEWLYEVLRDDVGPQRISGTLTNLTPEEEEAVVALWSEDPSADFHRLNVVLEAARCIG